MNFFLAGGSPLQIPSENCHGLYFARHNSSGGNEVDPRKSSDAQTIKIIISPGVAEIGHAEEISAGGGNNKIQKGIALFRFQILVLINKHLTARGMKESEGTVQSRINRPGPEFDQNALALFAM